MKNPVNRVCVAIWISSALVWSPSTRGQSAVLETERQIPIAYQADVVVVGGTTGAVSAAIAAAEQGASVFLAAPRPYLGEDVCGTLRLWLEADEQPEADLERKLFDVPASTSIWTARLPFAYQADRPADTKHAETSPPTRLSDRRFTDAVNDSVQFNEDVTIIADLSGNQRVKELHLLAYQRAEEFEVAGMEVWTSPNGKLWRSLGTVENPSLTDSAESAPIDLSMSIKQPCSFIKVLVRKTERASRMLLGELVIVEDRPDAKVIQQRQAPTPMQVKYALDQALIDAGVRFLYGSPVTDVLRDQDGHVAGIVMANRAGRQAVKAKVIIDATIRATTARLCGVQAQPYPSGEHTFQRVVVGSTLQSTDTLDVSQPGVQFASKQGLHDVQVCTMRIEMPDGGFRSFAAAEQEMRNATFDAELVDESDFLFQVPPDPIVGQTSASDDASDPNALDLRVCRPANVERMLVLSGCVDVSRSAAERLLRPLNLMRLGKRIGEAAAKDAATIDMADELVVASDAVGDANRFVTVKEFLQGARPTDQGLPTVLSPDRGLPVLGKYDVVVIGGGTGGVPAAIAAGRKGASTLLVEYQDHLGGVGTLGLISSYYHGYRKGFTTEVDRGVAALGGPKRQGGWNPVTKREYWRREVLKSGGEIWFSTLGVGAVVGGDFVKGVVVATPEGRGVVLAKSVVDSTGNADIAAAAGAETITTSADHVAMQGTGLSPRALGTGYTNTDYSFSDDSDPVDQWRMIVSARRKYKSSYDISPFIDSRERRRIVGELFITPLDLMNGKTYSDTIAMHQSNFDTHGYTVHPVFLINFPDKKQMTVPVPYRALLPKRLDGVLVTGLAISAHRDAMPILRMQACVQNQGYAAGMAAAMAAAENSSLRSINLDALQKHLVEIGSLEADVLNQQDASPPDSEQLAAAVASVIHDYRGLSIILDQSEAALPLLKQAYAKASSKDDQLVYANILGMLGDATGSDSLINEIEESSWDEGWNFRGMGQYGGSISRLDSHLIALGKSGDPRSLDVVLKKLQTLDASTEFSHHRAVAMALETIADRRAARPLAELLRKDGMTGHAILDIQTDVATSGNETRSQPLREIILARALYRCGDHNDVGKNILETYQKDLRGLFAKHADAVLRSRQ
ncbi:MAG: FAD-dependent oxidoreductase [Pirellulaceae bacterium]